MEQTLVAVVIRFVIQDARLKPLCQMIQVNQGAYSKVIGEENEYRKAVPQSFQGFVSFCCEADRGYEFVTSGFFG